MRQGQFGARECIQLRQTNEKRYRRLFGTQGSTDNDAGQFTIRRASRTELRDGNLVVVRI